MLSFLTGSPQIPPDTPLAEELSRDEVVEMANLTSVQTGVTGRSLSPPQWRAWSAGQIFYPAGRTQPSFSVSISDTPAVVANSLPVRITRQMSRHVIAWVSLNKDDLLDFWHTATPGRSRRSTISSNGCNVFDGGPT